jgi:dTMP kinase
MGHCGKLIVLEGGEGAGKSTLGWRLRDRYGDRVLLTREPGGPIGVESFASRVRELVLSDIGKGISVEAMFFSMWAARFEHVHTTILPALSNGKIVLCDRFDASTFAYQIGGEQALHLEEAFWMCRELLLGVAVPDLYFLLDGDPEKLLSRATARGDTNHFEGRQLEFHIRVRKGFQDFFERVRVERDSYCSLLDPFEHPDVLAARAVEMIDELFM